MGITATLEKKVADAKAGMKEMQLEQGMKQRQMMMSFQMGMGKERFWYYSVFVGTMYVLLPIGAIKTKNPAMIVGLFPMSVGWTFQYDMLYGDMQVRARKEAARLIKEEPERFFLPEGNGILN